MNADLEERLKTHGSKFSKFIDDTETLIRLAKILLNRQDTASINWFLLSDGYFVAKGIFTATPQIKKEINLPEDAPIGICGVVPVTEQIKERVGKTVRGFGEAADRILVNVVELDALPTTDSVVVTLTKKSMIDRAELQSIFTGVLAPPFPIKSIVGNKTDRQKCAEWWERHAFVQASEK